MRYVVDMALCAGHGSCALAAPQVYELDDDGFNARAGESVEFPARLWGAARDGALACPESAIQLQD